MWIILALVLVVVWLGFSFLLHITFWAIHLILVVAVISFILHFVFGTKKL